MGIVDIEQGVVLAADPGVLGQVGHVAGHGVDPVHAEEPGGGGRQRAQGLFEGAGSLERTRWRVAPALGPPAPLVDGLVGLGIDEHGALAGQDRNDRGVDDGDGRQQEGVGGAEQVGQLLFDVDVGAGAAQQPGPAGVGAPPP